MADHGFTVKDMLQEVGAELNIPPFMEGGQQLSAKEVQEGRCIASLRIHVERAIGRIKTFTILKQTLPISMAWLANQIICVRAYLSNFKSVLVPLESTTPTKNDPDVAVQQLINMTKSVQGHRSVHISTKRDNGAAWASNRVHNRSKVPYNKHNRCPVHR